MAQTDNTQLMIDEAAYAITNYLHDDTLYSREADLLSIKEILESVFLLGNYGLED